MEPSPFYTAALLVARDLNAAACSIYEHVSAAAAHPGQTGHEPGDKLILLSTSAMGQNLRGQPPDFDTTASKNLHGDTWTGLHELCRAMESACQCRVGGRATADRAAGDVADAVDAILSAPAERSSLDPRSAE